MKWTFVLLILVSVIVTILSELWISDPRCSHAARGPGRWCWGRVWPSPSFLLIAQPGPPIATDSALIFINKVSPGARLAPAWWMISFMTDRISKQVKMLINSQILLPLLRRWSFHKCLISSVSVQLRSQLWLHQSVISGAFEWDAS